MVYSILEPTKCLPGTEAKIKIMRERANRGLPLFHPEDATLENVIMTKIKGICRVGKIEAIFAKEKLYAN